MPEFAGVCDNLFQTARKSLILKRRDVRVVEGARLESEAGEHHQTILRYSIALALSDFALQIYHSMSSVNHHIRRSFEGYLSQSYHNATLSLTGAP